MALAAASFALGFCIATRLGHGEINEARSAVANITMPWVCTDDTARDRSPDTARILEALHLAPGLIAADIGAGAGYFTAKLARAVGPEGRVVATDIDPSMLQVLRRMVRSRHLDRVEVRAARDDDPRLGVSAFDRLLLVNVYPFLTCEAGAGRRLLAQYAAALRPGGSLVIFHDSVHTEEWAPPFGARVACSQPSGLEVAAWLPAEMELVRVEAVIQGRRQRGEADGYLLVARRR